MMMQKKSESRESKKMPKREQDSNQTAQSKEETEGSKKREEMYQWRKETSEILNQYHKHSKENQKIRTCVQKQSICNTHLLLDEVGATVVHGKCSNSSICCHKTTVKRKDVHGLQWSKIMRTLAAEPHFSNPGKLICHYS